MARKYQRPENKKRVPLRRKETTRKIIVKKGVRRRNSNVKKIIEKELDNVGCDYGWCGCCMQGIDSRDRICESCLEFSKHLIKRTLEVQKR